MRRLANVDALARGLGDIATPFQEFDQIIDCIQSGANPPAPTNEESPNARKPDL